MRILLLLIIVGFTLTGCSGGMKYYTSFNYLYIHKVSPDLIIDINTLLSKQATNSAIVNMESKLVASKKIIIHPLFGPLMGNPNDSIIKVIIQSGGGRIDLGYFILNTLNNLRKMGFKTECHIGDAASMAFTIMVVGCDNRLIKRNARIMQHRVAHINNLGERIITPATQVEDLNIAELEANALGVNLKEWFNLTKSEKDKFFTREEIEKYGIVHEWID